MSYKQITETSRERDPCAVYGDRGSNAPRSGFEGMQDFYSPRVDWRLAGLAFAVVLIAIAGGVFFK